MSYPGPVRWALLLFVPACSFGARAAPMTGDAPRAIDTAIGSDAPPMIDAAGSGCMDRWMMHTVRFHAPAELTELNTTSYERDPYVTPDELTIYFSATRSDSLPAQGGTDIYMATRTQIGDPFGTATKFAAASTTTGSEGKMSLTADGMQLFVSSDQQVVGSKGANDIWFAQQAAMGWGPLGQMHMAMVNSAGDELDPIVAADGTAIYYAPSSGQPQQLYVATRANEAGNFGAPSELTELADTAGGTGTADPAISADQKVILFSSSRTGSLGGNDIWYATRDDPSGPFGTPQPVPDINTGYYDGDALLSQDGCRLYFDSTRNGNSDWDLFVASQQ